MTKQEIETRLVNLEKMFTNLAERTSNRDNTNESNISNVKSEVATTNAAISDAWDETKLYVAGEMAIDNNTMYEALFNSKGLKPSENPTYWKARPIAEVLVELINKVNNL